MQETETLLPDYVTVIFADLENCSFWGGKISGTSRMIMYSKGEQLRSSSERRIQSIQKRYLTTTSDGHSCCQIVRKINTHQDQHSNLYKRIKRLITRYITKNNYENERNNSLR